MNWVFIDLIPWDYDVATPLIRPLGGSQSAMCYLATALARRGHQVTTLTATSAPRRINGVNCLSTQSIPRQLFDPPATLAIILNGPADAAAQVRQVARGPVLLWTQHADDQPAMAGLRDPACAAAWSRIVCISRWQRSRYEQQLGVPAARIDVLRNAIAPPFENLFPSADALARAKAGPPRLAYTSTPFRGLDVLLTAFPQIRSRHPACALEVYSSMQVYGTPAASDPYRGMYALCQSLEGASYRGSFPQPQLAQALASSAVLAYPNTFAETGCIAALEALAAGLFVVSTALGALPETCGGWGRLVPPLGADVSIAEYQAAFVAAVCQTLEELASDAAAFYRARYDQVQAINATCTWDVRAGEWEAAAAQWLAEN